MEKDVVYRSDFLILLFSYLEQQEGTKDIEKTEGDVIGLFCSILNQRLLIIDDKEFMAER